MDLMFPLLHNRGASPAAGMGPSSSSTVRWTMKETEHAQYVPFVLYSCSPPCGLLPSLSAAPSLNAVPQLHMNAVPHLTMLLSHEPLGLSLTPRLEIDVEFFYLPMQSPAREAGVQPAPK